MIVLKYVRNQLELCLICSIIAMHFPSRYRMPRHVFYPYFCDQSCVAVKHTSPLIMDAVQIGDRDSKTELLVPIIIQHGSVRTCTFQCRSTSATHYNHTIQQIRILTPITRSHYARPHSKATTETRSTHIHTLISIRTS